ncbi:MAG: Rossmann-like and DUF2520 domain-containing protein [Nitrososphaerota archaeon]
MTTPDKITGTDGTDRGNTPAQSAAPDALGAIGTIGVIGCGAVGGTLARALAAAGGTVVATTALHQEHADEVASRIPGCRAVATPEEVAGASDLVVLAAPDDAIAPLAERIPWSAGQSVFHLSGAIGTRALAAASERGARVAALHPLMTFTRTLAAAPIGEIQARLRGCVWALETRDESLRDALQAMVAALGGRVTLLAEADRVPYHIAGVLASNYVVTLMGAAVALWESFGADAALAREALLPLVRASVENLATLEPSRALSGPIARGDIGTLRAHLDWLAVQSRTSEEMRMLRDAYVALARLTVPLAEAKGTLSADRAGAIRALLDDMGTRKAE